MIAVQWADRQYTLSDDQKLLDLAFVKSMLRETYWAADRSPETIERSVDNSICLGLFDGDQQVGFARAVTDQATFSWICDVIVDPAHRGRGLGKWMMSCLLIHPSIQGTTCALRTETAHSLYERFGFERVEYLRRPRDSARPLPP